MYIGDVLFYRDYQYLYFMVGIFIWSYTLLTKL